MARQVDIGTQVRSEPSTSWSQVEEDSATRQPVHRGCHRLTDMKSVCCPVVQCSYGLVAVVVVFLSVLGFFCHRWAWSVCALVWQLTVIVVGTVWRLLTAFVTPAQPKLVSIVSLAMLEIRQSHAWSLSRCQSRKTGYWDGALPTQRSSTSYLLTLWRPLLPYGYSYKEHHVPDRVKPSFVIFDGLRAERQSAQLSKKDDSLTWSGTWCFIAVPIWRQWPSKG